MPSKADLIDSVSKTLDIPKPKAADAINAVCEGILDLTFGQPASGKPSAQKLILQGFGTFSVKHRKARKSRNPSTGGTVDVPASKTLGFKPAQALKSAD